MGYLNDFYQQFKDRFNIFMIYITEAHAFDVWPIGMSAGTINYSHKTIEDRSKCAYKFQAEYNVQFPIYLDNMKDEYETVYSAWPFRYHVVSRGRMTLVPKPIDSEFVLDELTDHLETLTGKKLFPE